MLHAPLADLPSVQRLGQEMVDLGQPFRALPAPLGGGIETRIVQGNGGMVSQPL